jgi:hypothetical protein
VSGHHRILLCSADIAAASPALAMAARFAPSVPVRDLARFRNEPRRALLDSATAEQVLGWQPRYRWSTRGREPNG